MSFPRKQQSRLVPAEAEIQAIGTSSIIFWIPACAGMTKKAPSPGFGFASAGLSRQGRGGVLHSAKVVTLFFLWRRWVTEAAVCFFFTPIFPILFTKGPSSLAFRLPSPKGIPRFLSWEGSQGQRPPF